MSATNLIVLSIAAPFVLYVAALIWVFLYTRAWAGPETSRAVSKKP
jgi:hypothetical protein